MDERLALIEKEKQNAINQSNNTYNQMLQDNQNLYNQQNEYANTYETTQNEILDKQLAFQQEQINQQKEVARQNMETESKKAKNDYTAYNNPYGYQAESFASQGLSNSGVTATARLGSWNTYQNRLATANKAMQDAFVQYDNDMNEARLSNDAQKAQNALAKLQLQLQYAESYYNNKNTISQNQLSTNQNLDSEYYNRYQTEYANIQAEQQRQEAIRQWEAELAEQQRQYNESLAYQKQQDALAQANWEREYALAQQSAKSSDSGGSGGNTILTDGSEDNNSSKTSSNGLNIIANPYTNTINEDAKYGVFNTGDGSGYQPNNIGGVKLSKSGKKVEDIYGNSAISVGGSSLSKQNIWTANGKYYVWDGAINDYIDITSDYKMADGKYINIKWGGI